MSPQPGVPEDDPKDDPKDDPTNVREHAPDARGGGPGSGYGHRDHPHRAPQHREPHEGSPSPEHRRRWGPETDGPENVRRDGPGSSPQPRDAGVTPDAGRGRDSGTSTPPHDHPGERHQPRQTDGHGHVRHPVTDWG
ncbi:hypothetical protein ABH927_006803, partial [Planotetraspora sp. GP83]